MTAFGAPSAAASAATVLQGDGSAPALQIDAEAGKAKKSKKKLIALFLVLALVGFEAKGKIVKPHYGPGDKVPAGQVIALGSSTLTTNLADGHLVQIGISLQLTKPASVKTISADTDELTNASLSILSRDTYPQLLATSGRTVLAHQLLAAYQKILGRSEGAEQVSAVYFTSFVLQ